MPSRLYEIQQKSCSLGDTFKIKDKSGKNVFIARSKVLPLTEKLILEDMAGNALIKIHGDSSSEDVYRIMLIRSNGSEQHVATINDKSSWKYQLKIESIYGDYQLKHHDIRARSFTLTKNGIQAVANISKMLFATTDTYEVEIFDTIIQKQEDDAFILALIIILDCTFDSDFDLAAAK